MDLDVLGVPLGCLAVDAMIVGHTLLEDEHDDAEPNPKPDRPPMRHAAMRTRRSATRVHTQTAKASRSHICPMRNVNQISLLTGRTTPINIEPTPW